MVLVSMEALMANPCQAHRNVKAEHCPICLKEEIERLQNLASAWYTQARSKGWVRAVFDENHPLDDDMPSRKDWKDARAAVVRLRDILEDVERGTEEHPFCPSCGQWPHHLECDLKITLKATVRNGEGE